MYCMCFGEWTFGDIVCVGEWTYGFALCLVNGQI